MNEETIGIWPDPSSKVSLIFDDGVEILPLHRVDAPYLINNAY